MINITQTKGGWGWGSVPDQHTMIILTNPQLYKQSISNKKRKNTHYNTDTITQTKEEWGWGSVPDQHTMIILTNPQLHKQSKSDKNRNRHIFKYRYKSTNKHVIKSSVTGYVACLAHPSLSISNEQKIEIVFRQEGKSG